MKRKREILGIQPPTGLGDKWGISCSLVEEKGIRRAKSEKS